MAYQAFQKSVLRSQSEIISAHQKKACAPKDRRQPLLAVNTRSCFRPIVEGIHR
jgi:hypothetical protein